MLYLYITVIHCNKYETNFLSYFISAEEILAQECVHQKEEKEWSGWHETTQKSQTWRRWPSEEKRVCFVLICSWW